MIPTAKIADFGLAKSFVGVGGTKLTKANEFAGSLYYTPPEQIVNFSRVGPTADIYSAGVTLYQILTGSLPYNFRSKSSTNSMKDSLLVVLEEPIIPIKERSANIPATLAAIVEKAIAKKAQDRFSTAGIFKAELQQYQETMP
jgi:serine/threonine-protein kinase